MSQGPPERQLVVLSADKDIEMTIRGLLTRPQALEIRPVAAEHLVHPQHDPGCRLTPEVLLRPYAGSFSHALVVMDHEGSGGETTSRTALESQIEEQLAKNGWGDRAAVVVIAPELENWVWSDSPEVDARLGWREQHVTLRSWLAQQNLWPNAEPKPVRPKEAMECVLRHVRKPRSSSIYRQLAETVGLRRCEDPAFEKLRETLRRWFPSD
ncbi:MAG: hypothetical protein GX621_17365 [Pirellulaceae bacterium]|nr:hypothetical protein [Pirellulaceae bacterium]